MRKHKNQEDVEIKAQHRIGQGPLQVAIEEQICVHGPGQDDSLEDEDAFHDDPVDDEEEEEDENLAQESYRALK